MVRQKIIGYYPFDGKHQKILREKAIDFLGGKCSNPNCLVPNGCTDRRCLQIDHVNGISVDDPRLVGIMLYEDILNNPKSKEKYQLLCANCNWIKRAERKENRGYIEKAIAKPKLPTAFIGGCTNPDISCKVCTVEDCGYRYKPRLVLSDYDKRR